MSQTTAASLTAEIINPVMNATRTTFETMVGVTLRKKSLDLLTGRTPFHPITAVIQLSGAARGSICLSLERRTAFTLVYKMLDEQVAEVTPLVCDTVSEFANVIAGSAKDAMQHLNLELGLPNVVRGIDCKVSFPTASVPMAVTFTSHIGGVIVAFAFSAN